MASFKLNALSPWKAVYSGIDYENNSEFEGFGGLEVLEDYEVIQTGEEQIEVGVVSRKEVKKRKSAPSLPVETRTKQKKARKVKSELDVEDVSSLAADTEHKGVSKSRTLSKLLAKDGTKSPADNGTKLPAKDGTKLSAKDGTKPPAKVGTKLPAKVGTKLPAKDRTKPPAKDVTKVPTKDGTKLPAKDGTKPPAKDGTKLPAKDGTKPPAMDVTKVPTKDGTKLPAKDGTKLPAKDGTKVPAKDGTKLPAKDGTKLPAKDGTKLHARDGTKERSKRNKAKQVVSSEPELERAEMNEEERGSAGDSATSTKRHDVLKDMEGWNDLFVPRPVLRSLSELGYKAPTLIQALTLPAAIRDRQDILGAAETGSGKTLAFGIPVIDKILKLKLERELEPAEHGVYALVLTPTRELCVQVKNHLVKAAQYTNIAVVAIFGGMSTQKQVRLLKSRPEIIVATPGRLWDLMNSEEVVESYLSTIVHVPLLVIDEADKMVEKGHFEELTKILTLMKGDAESSRRRQCFVFSATLTFVHLPPDRLKVGKKRKKSKKFQISKESKLDELIEAVGILKRPKVIDITEKTQTASGLVESCIFCSQDEKDLYLYYFLHRHRGRTLVFSNSIDCIRRLVSLFSLLKKPLLPLHASMHQKQRLKNLENFTASADSILIATDVAARGLDIPNIQHVVHYQVPRTSEGYVHRSGRTARALKQGLSVMFVDEKDIQTYRKIIKSLNKEDTLSMFPVDQTDLKTLKPVVSLAQSIDKTQHTMDKSRRREDWFVKMAREADIELSDDDNDNFDTRCEREKEQELEVKERRRLDVKKGELAALLEGGANSGPSYRGKYPTVSGKLVLPPSCVSKRDTQAITLVSRKRKR